MSRLEEFKAQIDEFCLSRDWDQFHGHKDLAIGVATEGAELLELFRFLTDQQIAEKMSDDGFRQKVSDEMADVFYFLIRMSSKADIDLYSALEKKMLKNAEKYPVEKSRGKNAKYDELP